MDDPSGQSSDTRGVSQDASAFLQQTRHPKPLMPNDVWGENCPICLKKHPSLAHVALHLRKIAVFTLPKSIHPDEDSILGDQGSETANIDDQESMPSLSTFKRSNKGDSSDEETDDDWEQWDTKTPGNVPLMEMARQEGVPPLEQALLEASLNPSVAGSKGADQLLHRMERTHDRPATVTAVASGLGNISFYARFDPLEPNYQEQPVRHGSHSFWIPPNSRDEYTRRSGILFRWMGGVMNVVGYNDPVTWPLHRIHSAATVFTQYPDTPLLLVVPFDAQMTHPHQNSGGWKPLYFQHVQIGNTQRFYSAVSATGDRQHIAAPGSRHWMPQLLPRIYDHQSGSPKIQAGLVGSLPLLLALAAFSAPPNVLAGVLTTCVSPGSWRPHDFAYPAGRKCCCIHEYFGLTGYRYPGTRHGCHDFLRSYQSTRV